MNAGTVIERTVANIDWFPTLLDMAGVELEEDIAIRGRSFVSLLRGQEVDWNDTLYGEYSTHHQSETQMRMLRTPDWKLVKDYRDSDRDELYNLKDDPAEKNNLIGSEDRNVQRMQYDLEANLLSRMETINDPVWWQVVAPP